MRRVSALPDPDVLAQRALERCRDAAARYEFRTFLVGVRAKRLAGQVLAAELAAWKASLKRRVGSALEAEWAEQGRVVDLGRPDVALVYDVDRDAVVRDVRALLLYGRYRKLSRELPQTRADWPCPVCRRERSRRGECAPCRGTGRRYPDSVESLLAGPAARALGAKLRRVRLHGMGREDVDVRCLGAGRPFVLEVGAPRRRTADWADLAAAVEAGAAGRVELPAGLRPVTGPDVVARLKAWPAEKVYRVRCRAEASVAAADVERVAAALGGAELAQRTPGRVAHRRADRVRRRRVRSCEVLEVCEGGAAFELRVATEAGTYVKELVSGDEGRTEPSVAGLLGVACVCAELDVADVGAADADVLGPT